MGWLKNMIAKLFKIIPATDREITIKEPLTFHENVLKQNLVPGGSGRDRAVL